MDEKIEKIGGFKNARAEHRQDPPRLREGRTELLDAFWHFFFSLNVWRVTRFILILKQKKYAWSIPLQEKIHGWKNALGDVHPETLVWRRGHTTQASARETHQKLPRPTSSPP